MRHRRLWLPALVVEMGCGSFDSFGGTESGPGDVDVWTLERLEVRNFNTGSGGSVWEPTGCSVTSSTMAEDLLYQTLPAIANLGKTSPLLKEKA